VTTGRPAGIFRRLEPLAGEARMMDEDLPPKKKTTHEIGQDLSLLSISELADRIALLKEEIARLEAAKASKSATRSAADQFFKR
jgi:uncharacterized small protein (DUF1192 family)